MLDSAGRIVKIGIRCVAIILICAIIALGALSVAFLIPSEPIVENITASVSVFRAEGAYPNKSAIWYSRLDNWTDSIILANSAYDGETPLLEKALLMPRYTALADGEPLHPVDSLIACYAGDGEAELSVVTYPRYWHGYLLFTKPLLYFFNYQTIRGINLVVQILLTVTVIVLLWHRGLQRLALPYLLSWGMLSPQAIGASLQFSAVFYLYSVGILLLLILLPKLNKREHVVYFFLLLGIMTSFFDYLTYPLAVWGMPLIVWLLAKGKYSLKSDLMDIVLYALVWGTGYVGMWATKWVLASLLTSENIIADAFRAIVIRSSAESAQGETLSLLVMLVNHLTCIGRNPATVLGGSYTLALLIQGVVAKRRLFPGCVVFGLIAVAPFAWYLVAFNHSYVHYWFTYKALVVTGFAGMCMFADRQKIVDDAQKRMGLLGAERF